MKVFYRDLLEVDDNIAETFLILIKKLSFQLSRNKHYVTSDGDEWRLKLWRNELNLNSDDKPEYIMKSDERLVIDIESDFFDLIDKITNEFDSFVRNELLGSEGISRYLITIEVLSKIVIDAKKKNTVIKT